MDWTMDQSRKVQVWTAVQDQTVASLVYVAYMGPSASTVGLYM